MKNYDDKFFEYVNSGSINSARTVLPFIHKHLAINSVLDIGCGQGAWLSVWQELGINNFIGIDGSYVDSAHLLIPEENFVTADLAEKFSINKQFDLIQCLEVAEHLPLSKASQFVAAIAAHGKTVMFSAAPKGQGGDHHVNEQGYDFWRSLFRAHNYFVFDCIRPEISQALSVEPWYRYNTFLYVHKDSLTQLPKKLRSTQVADGTSLRDISPFPYKLRKLLVRLLPLALATKAAKIKEAIVARSRRNNG